MSVDELSFKVADFEVTEVPQGEEQKQSVN